MPYELSMPRYTAKIGNIADNAWPDPNSIRHYFLQYAEDEWLAGGSTDASFFAYGIEGTEDKAFYTDRIDARLGIWDDPQLGFCLLFSKTGAGIKEHFFSLGDEREVGSPFETRTGEVLPRGCFVSPGTAWLAVEDFLKTGGKRSARIKWVDDDDLPSS